MKRKILSLILALSVLMSCVAMTASADGELTLIDGKRIPYPATGIKPESSNWIYNYDTSTLTEMNDGLGGIYKATNKTGRYAQVTKGKNDNRAALFMINKNADYFADNYFVFTANIYGQTPFIYRVGASTYDKTFDSTVLKANQWNNFTMIYDTTKSLGTGVAGTGVNAHFYINGELADKIGTGPDVSKGVQMRLTLTDPSSTYYVDDIAIYKASTLPTVTMPTVTADAKYTVDDNVITYTYGEQLTVADITSTGTAVRAYDSTDTEMKTALAEDAVLSAGDVVVVEAPVNAATEYICRYNYYKVAEGEAPAGPEQIGDSSTYWIYDEATTTLTFSGTGALPDWTENKTGDVKDDDHHSYRPWYDIKDGVTKVVIGEGITKVGAYTCAQFKSLKTVEFPTTLTTIGERAFMYTGLEDVVLNEGLTTIESNAFMHQQNSTTYTPLSSITIPNSVTTIAEDAFTFQRATVAIKCNSDSYARTFARNNSFRYILIGKDYELSFAPKTGVPSYRNFTGVDKEVVAVIFNRKSGKINDIYFETITLKGDGTVAEVPVPKGFSQEAGSATRIMLWNNWNDITPLCDDEFKQHK